jgi:glucose/arabinose dehydrogenase/mono/diheme cytochrome c family protein
MNTLSGIVRLSALLAIIFSICSCTPRPSSENTIAADSVTIAIGRNAFRQDCSACHNFRQDGIGPRLLGVTTEVPVEWIQNFIRDPQAVINSGDERAQKLLAQYHAVMPSFPKYTDDDINAIIAFLDSRSAPERRPARDPNALLDPIPERIMMSDIVVGLEPYTQIPPSGDPPLLTRIVKMDFQPETKQNFILDLRGKLYKMQDNKPMVYMDMAELRPNFIEKPGLATGFGSFAFHPEFSKNGLLYTTHSERPGSGKADFAYIDSIEVMMQWVLTEWKTEKPSAFPFSGKGRELMRVNMVHSFHGMQEIKFNPLAKQGDEDYGLLYVGIGDGASVEMGYPFLVHAKDKIWGTIIRIDPSGSNSTNGKYGIPPGNPFALDKDKGVLGEIYALGFRNPHRLIWSKAGQMLASNIGHSNIESLNIILPGHDYGWPIREGTFVMNAYGNMNDIFPLPDDDSIYNITYPVVQFDHDEGNAISAGFEYTGKAVPELHGKFIFGDIPSGRLFYVEMKDLKLGSQAPIKEFQVSLNAERRNLAQICGNNRVDLRFGKDAQGELYIMTKPDGKVYKIVKNTGH